MRYAGTSSVGGGVGRFFCGIGFEKVREGLPSVFRVFKKCA